MKTIIGTLLAGLGLGVIAVAAGGGRKLAVGDTAPLFELAGSDGKTHLLADHLGVRPVIVAWFPKAKTPG